MMNPSDSLVDWVLKTVPTMGAGWCPPGMLGIGVGGTAEKAVQMAKEVLMEDIDMYELLQRGPQTKLEELRVELYEKVNAPRNRRAGIGRPHYRFLTSKSARGPPMRQSKPVAMIPNCAATRHAHFVLDGFGAFLPRTAEPGSLAQRTLGTGLQHQSAGKSRRADSGGSGELEARTDFAAQRPHVDRS